MGAFRGEFIAALVLLTSLWTASLLFSLGISVLYDYMAQRWWAWRGTLTHYPLLRTNYALRDLTLPYAELRRVFDLMMSVTYPPRDPTDEAYYERLADVALDLWAWNAAWNGAGYTYCQLSCVNAYKGDARWYDVSFTRTLTPVGQ